MNHGLLLRAALLISVLSAPAAAQVDADAHPRPPSGEDAGGGRIEQVPGVRRVPIRPPGLPYAPGSGPSVQGKRHECIEIDEIGEARVMGDRSIELMLSDARRIVMLFADDCPFIGFYEGFYLQRTKGGKLCARKDKVIARSGVACDIEWLEQRPSEAEEDE